MFRFVARFVCVRIEDSSLNRFALNGIRRDFFGGIFSGGIFVGGILSGYPFIECTVQYKPIKADIKKGEGGSMRPPYFEDSNPEHNLYLTSLQKTDQPSSIKFDTQITIFITYKLSLCTNYFPRSYTTPLSFGGTTIN